MMTSLFRRSAFLLACLVCFASPALLANRLAGEIVSGQITSVSAPDRIGVDGHVYFVKRDSAAARMLGSVSVGQHVDLVLDGPRSSSATQVTGLIPPAQH